MKVFISWSGIRSKYIAETLRDWLEQVQQAVEPWISTEIEKGTRWREEISGKLEESQVALICLTKDNLASNWIHFEAGAISKTKDAYVCTFLYDITPANVKQPLSQFQHTEYNKGEVLKLIKTINKKVGDSGGKALKEKNLESVFKTFWPQLEDTLKKAPESKSPNTETSRSDREIIEETLQTVRNLKGNFWEAPNFLNEKTLNESIDFWLEKYAELNGLIYSKPDLEGKEKDILNWIGEFPEMRLLFGNVNNLFKKIKERIQMAPPF